MTLAARHKYLVDSTQLEAVRRPLQIQHETSQLTKMLLAIVVPTVIAFVRGVTAADAATPTNSNDDFEETLFSFPVNLTVPGATAKDPGTYETGWMMNLPGNDTSFGCFDNETTHEWGITEPALGVSYWNVTLRETDPIPSLPNRKKCEIQGIPETTAKQVTFSMPDSGQNDFIRFFGQSCALDMVNKRAGCCFVKGSLYMRQPPRGGEPGRTGIWLPCPRPNDIDIKDIEDTDRGPDQPKED